MYHYLETLTNTRGDSLVGYQVKLIDPATGAVVPIFADESGTPIATVSGIANAMVTGVEGEIDFWVADGTYNLEIFTPLGLFFRRLRKIIMQAGGGTVEIPQIGTFATVPGTVMRVGSDSFRTTGYSVVGIGAAEYAYDPAVNAAYVTSNPRTSILLPTLPSGGTVRGFRLVSQVVTPYMFGALGLDRTPDDGAALNAWMAYFTTNLCEVATGAGGRFGTSIPLIMDYAVAYNAQAFNNYAPHTANVDLSLRIEATAGSTGDKLLTIKDAPVGVAFKGRPRIMGNGIGAAYAGRKWMTGIYYQNSSSARMDGSYCESFAYAGFELSSNPDNNNTLFFGSIISKRCGSGSTLSRLNESFWTGASSRQANTGSSLSNDQRSTFTLQAMPPVYIDDPKRTVTVDIDGELYLVKTIDRVNNRISVFPWVPAAADPTARSVSIVFHYGGAFVTHSNDSNVINGDQIKALACGCALDYSSLFGGFIGEVLSEPGGTAIRLSNDPTAQVYSLTIGHFYCEFEAHAFDVVSLAPSTTFVKFLSGNINLAKWHKLYETRDGAGVKRVSPLFGIDVGGEEGTWVRNPIREDINFPTLNFNLPGMDGSVWTGAFTQMDFQLSPMPAYVNGLFGKRGVLIHVRPPFSISPTNAPTKVTFTRPSGWLLNGAADVVSFEGFSGPASFYISADLSPPTPNLYVSCVAGLLPEGRAGVSPDRGDAAQTVVPYKDFVTQRYATDLTADRLLTLGTGKNGNRFRVVRTGGGAFALNIGSPLVKALTAANSWAEVEHDGTAWRLAQSGTL